MFSKTIHYILVQEDLKVINGIVSKYYWLCSVCCILKYVHTHIYIYIYMYIYKYIYIHIYIYICIYTNIYTYIYIYIHKHTYIYTFKFQISLAMFSNNFGILNTTQLSKYVQSSPTPYDIRVTFNLITNCIYYITL